MKTRIKISPAAYAVVVLLTLSGCAAPVVTENEESDPAPAIATQELRGGICRRDSDCPQPGAPCVECSDGSFACPAVECVRRRCVYSFPQCPPPYEPCAGKACGDSCTVCDPADPDCVETDVLKFCQPDGACSPLQPTCSSPKVFCGGIAGIPCPGAGTCFDDPSDDCDPRMGGADCGGVCECDVVGLCRFPGHWDGSPQVCGCVDGGGSCGGNTCGRNQFCCNASCGICAPIGGACIQVVCDATQ
jgi:hypothetical protein